MQPSLGQANLQIEIVGNSLTTSKKLKRIEGKKIVQLMSVTTGDTTMGLLIVCFSV